MTNGEPASFSLKPGALDTVVDLVLEARGSTRDEAERSGLVIHPGHVAKLAPGSRRFSRLEEVAWFAYFLFAVTEGLLAPRGTSPKFITVDKVRGPRSDPGLSIGVLLPDASENEVSRVAYLDALDVEPASFAESVVRLGRIADEIIGVANELLPLARAAEIASATPYGDPAPTGYLPLDLPAFFELQFFSVSSGEWWGEAHLGADTFKRNDDGSYVTGTDGSPVWFRCVEHHGDHFIHVDGTGKRFAYRLVALNDDGSPRAT